jgi:hypothetical protein
MMMGLAVAVIIGRGGFRIGHPTIARGEVGCAYFLVELLVVLLVLGVARLLARIAGRTIAVSYAAGVAGAVAGVLVAVPTTFLLWLFVPNGQLDTILVPIALRVSLVCGSITIAAVAAVLAPTIAPAPRGDDDQGG